MRITLYKELLNNHKLPLIIGLFGLLVSITLLLNSFGSIDMITWTRFATEIRDMGLTQLYVSDEKFNHPPLMGLFAWLLLEISYFINVPYPIIFKLIPVLANVATALLLGDMWSRKAGIRMGVWAFAAFNIALSSILVAAFHGNTDCLVAFLCLLSLYFIEQKKLGSAGLVMAVAFNIKIIPLLLVCPAMAGIRSKKGILQYCLGLSVGLIPFIIAWFVIGKPFISNILGYNSINFPWGVPFLLTIFPSGHFGELQKDYILVGKILIITSVLLLSIIGFIKHWKPASMMTCAFILFLIFAPGFGVQYVAYLSPFIFSLNLAKGSLYAFVSGIFIAVVYNHYLLDIYPLLSNKHAGTISFPTVILGLLLWCIIIVFFKDFILPKFTYQQVHNFRAE